MHTGPMKESEGSIETTKTLDRKCRKCGHDRATYQLWESSCGGYEDEKFTCLGCGDVTWVEGPDA